MSFYNMINGYNPSVTLIFPMLDRKYQDFQRFRNCFAEDDQIIVYTRMGGDNGKCWEDRKKKFYDKSFLQDTCDCDACELWRMLRKHPTFRCSVQDSNDCTYCSFHFDVPEKWKADYDNILNCEFDKSSKDYLDQIEKIVGEDGKNAIQEAIGVKNDL